MRLDVYVPAQPARTLIDPGSGIVGTPQDNGRVLLDYEGNRFGSTNMCTYADRVHHAAGRHTDRYPTIARSLADTATVVRVGSYDNRTGVVDLDGPAERALLAQWLECAEADLDTQLTTAGTVRHQMLREVTAARASGDPTQVFAANHMARRYKLDD